MRTAKHTPILLLTDSLEAKKIVELLCAGADTYLEKPLNMDVCIAQANALIQLYFDVDINYNQQAKKLFYAVQDWLKGRLGLDISPEKSKIVNLRKQYSEFLGLRIKAANHGSKQKPNYVVERHIKEKSVAKIADNMKSLYIILNFQDLERGRNTRRLPDSTPMYSASTIITTWRQRPASVYEGSGGIGYPGVVPGWGAERFSLWHLLFKRK